MPSTRFDFASRILTCSLTSATTPSKHSHLRPDRFVLVLVSLLFVLPGMGPESRANPTITNLNPSSATATGAAFLLTVNGTGFVSGAVVQWNGAGLSTTYASATQLIASVPASLIAVPRSANIAVTNPGGGVSNSVSFPVITPMPVITSLSPSSAAAAGNAFTLTVNGTGFFLGATVQWNGSALPTTFVSSTQMTASVAASLIASQGNAEVTVSSSGVVSNAVSFTIAPVVPGITSLSPFETAAGGGAFTLTVNGTGLLSGATVQWNGSALPTTFVSSTQLTATVSASLIGSVGNAQVTVINPDGAVSNFGTFYMTGWVTMATVQWEVDNQEFLTINSDGSWSLVDMVANCRTASLPTLRNNQAQTGQDSACRVRGRSRVRLRRLGTGMSK